jgi:hypothetical protein
MALPSVFRRIQDKENPSMKPQALTPQAYLTAAMFAIVAMSSNAPAQAQTSATEAPQPNTEVAACKATALIALTEKDPSIKDIFIDQDGLSVARADTRIEDTPVKHIIMGEAYLQTNKKDKPRRFLCIIGDKGKVLLTFFTQQ